MSEAQEEGTTEHLLAADMGEVFQLDTSLPPTSRVAIPGQMPVVNYLVSEHAPYYRLVLDILLDEESMLGLHLPTAEIDRRVKARMDRLGAVEGVPDMEYLLRRLFEWGNVDRIHNTHRKSTAAEYLRRDYLFQLTPRGAEVHQTLRRIDSELGATGALQASMLPEVLNALHTLCEALNAGAGGGMKMDRRGAYAALQRLIAGFTQLSDNAKRFVQGLNAVMENSDTLTEQVFIAYKDEVVLHLQTFVMELVRYSTPIANAIDEAERRQLRDQFLQLAQLEAAPTIGMSLSRVAERDAARFEAQWNGLRSWVLGDAERLPITTALQDRAADAVSRIVAVVRKFNDARFRRIDRTMDLLILAEWFAATSDPLDRASLWRSAFGMYSARHLGTPHDQTSDLDVRPNTSWWTSPAAPVEARLRKQGPRARTGRPPRLQDPRDAKRRLAQQRAFEQEAREHAIERLTRCTPAQISEFPLLTDDEIDLLLHLLRTVLVVPVDKAGLRRARTSDGRLSIVLCPARQEGVEAATVLTTERGLIAMEDFELDITDLKRATHE
ncbi:TIGR02677 family protein [Promicromonospora sukumoe]